MGTAQAAYVHGFKAAGPSVVPQLDAAEVPDGIGEVQRLP